jgi:hypothetical protein
MEILAMKLLLVLFVSMVAFLIKDFYRARDEYSTKRKKNDP